MNPKSLDDLVRVYKAHGMLDAESIKAFLEAQGIKSELSPTALGQIYGLTVGDLGEVEILVAPEDTQKAIQLLHSMEDGEFSNEQLISGTDQDFSTLNPLSNAEDEDLKNRKRVLFICTGNSARSQLAEAMVNHDCWQEWIAFSAGVKPAGFVHPMVERVLAEAGIYHQGRSKNISEFIDQTFDLVITVCDQARETCPLWLNPGAKIHIGFEDPAAFVGTEQEKYQFFENIFKLIRSTVPASLRNYTE